MLIRKITVVLLSLAIIFTSIIGYQMKTKQDQNNFEFNQTIEKMEGETSFTLEDESLGANEDVIVDLLAHNINENEKSTEINKDSVLNTDGGLDIPFDEAYPEVFEEGNVAYSKDTLMIKFDNSFSGSLNDSLKEAGVSKIEKMFDTDNATWYEAFVNEGTDVKETIESVRSLNEVILAEYNFVYETAVMEVEDWDSHHGGNKHVEKQWHRKHCGIEKAWQLGKDEFEAPGGDPSVVIAVIDTGVDYTHEDLADNIWRNIGEIEGNGKDDDGNGYIDDIYGVDITAGKNSGNDDNGHGTHVAGIIGAVDNEVGLVGLAYSSKIMPVKAGDASGYFLQSNVAKAILYAYENGADVINMSFGGTACSTAVQDALSVAYTRCVLVAAAGNDGAANSDIPIYPAALSYVIGVMSVNEDNIESTFTNYDSVEYDSLEYEVYAPGENIWSTVPGNRYAELSGTSMAAPVVASQAALLRSYYKDRNTYPTKFIYGQIVGTADEYKDNSNLKYVKCAHSDSGMEKHNVPGKVNFYNSFTQAPTPKVFYSDFTIFDSEGFIYDKEKRNNGDGIIDAGETIACGVTLKNKWGLTKDTIVTVTATNDLGVTNPYVTIINNQVNYGSIGTYTEKDCGKIYENDQWIGWENPFYIQISKDCPNDYSITLNFLITSENGLNDNDPVIYKTKFSYTFFVRNGVFLPTKIYEDMTLTNDNYYIVNQTVTIMEGATLTIEEGTKVQFWSSNALDPYAETGIVKFVVNGKFVTKGTAENPVELFPSDLYANYGVMLNVGGNGLIELDHTIITNPLLDRIHSMTNCEMRQNFKSSYRYRYFGNGTVLTNDRTGYLRGDHIKGCVFYKLGENYNTFNITSYDEKSIFEENIIVDSNFALSHSGLMRNNVFYGNNVFENEDQDPNSVASSIAYSDSPQNNLYVHDYMTLTSTGNTYLTLSKNQDSTSTELMNPHILGRFLELIYGDWVAINSVEEAKELYENLKDSKTDHYRTQFRMDNENGVLLNHDGTLIPYELGFKHPLSDYDVNLYKDKSNLNIYSQDLPINNWNSQTLYDLIEVPSIYPVSIELKDYVTYLSTNEKYDIVAKTYPTNIDYTLTYKSEDEKVAKVDENGIVTAVGAGTTNIRVYTEDKGIYTYLTVNVIGPTNVSSISPSQENIYLNHYEAAQIKIHFNPSNTTQRHLTYSSSDENVAIVDANGFVYAVGEGQAIIEVKGENNVATKVNVIVYPYVQSLHFEEETYYTNLYVDDGNEMIPITDSPMTNLEWESSNPEVCYVNEEGKLIKNQKGHATIRAKDKSSNEHDDLLVIVGDAEPYIDVRKVQFTYSTILILTQDGEIWCLGSDEKYLKTGLKDVKDFIICDFVNSSIDEIDLYILNEQNEVYCYNVKNDEYTTSEPIMTNVTSLEGIQCVYGYPVTYDRCMALKEDGSLWNLVNNEQIMISDSTFIDVAVFESGLYVLTGAGELYYTGSLYPDEFILVDLSVKQIHPSNSGLVADLGNEFLVYSQSDIYEVINRFTKSNENDQVYSDTLYSIKDGNLYGTNRYGSKLILDRKSDVSNIHEGRHGEIYIETLDHKLYKGEQRVFFGKEEVKENLDLIVAEDNLVIFNEEMTLSSNVDASSLLGKTVLTQDELVLSFDEAIYEGIGFNDIQVTDANGKKYEVDVNLTLSQLIVKPTTGFVNGVTYIVEIPKGVVQNNTLGYKYNEDSYTYQFVAVEMGDTKHGLVVDQDIVDARNHVTQEEFDAFWENFVSDGLNTRFYSNVILNRLDTNDVDRWLRIKSTEGYNQYCSFGLGGNYWGTTNEFLINKQILDYDDYGQMADLIHGAILTEAPENTYPFVTEAYLEVENKPVNIVGNELVTFVVEFNRDMDTSIDLLVRFGSYYPYADYEIDGEYITPRQWKGTMQLTTIIEGGYQYWSVSNGQAADSSYKLYTDWGRFPFLIDTSEAKALIMEADATETGIQLTWTQDDFDTLAGYNVYRSTQEDGYYTKLNRTVIPYDVQEWFDDTVIPGVRYYYNFTVVETDLKESVPSGKVNVVSMDTMAPDIYHTPIYEAFTGNNLVVSAVVTDNLSVENATLYYRTTGTKNYQSITMDGYHDRYSAIIRQDAISVNGLEYYIEVSDGISKAYKGTAEEPYQVTVYLTVPDKDKGDVDGDGTITLTDAMKLLYAINDKYNMNTEEFSRADIDGDRVLETVEALMILRYVNGSIDSIPVGE